MNNRTIFDELISFVTVKEVQLALAKLGKVLTRQQIDLDFKKAGYKTMRLNKINIYRLSDGIDYIQRKVKANRDNVELIILNLKKLNNEN